MTNHNSAKAWDKLWRAEGKTSWRGSAMKAVYDRIDLLLPKKARVLDIGGGVGILAERLIESGRVVEVWDISPEAVKQAKASGIPARVVDLEGACPEIPKDTWVVATEVVEHLSEKARRRLLQQIERAGGKGFLSVPNDRLGPEEEPQHTVKFNAVSFRKYLGDFRPRVEVLGPKADPHGDPAFLLAVLNPPAKTATLSLTLPVRDEGKDLGHVLATFRGAADEIVVGIDPRTKDNTREVAERYADRIIDLVDPEGPVPGNTYEGPRCRAMAEAKEARVRDGGVHFAWVRNQCLDACKSDWIFMTEGHELLVEGFDTLRHLHLLPEATKIVMVWRSDVNQRWAFPWLHRNLSTILYERSTHNSLSFPDSYMVVKLPEIRTLHDRVHAKSVARKEQRKIQNRVTLQDDWMTRGSEFSKYYLASEWREFDSENGTNNAEKHFRELLALPSKNGSMRYQARLILAKLLGERRLKEEDTVVKGELLKEIREILFQCSSEDWSRTEHWLWLGDLATEAGQHEEAVQFYTYGAARIGNPPFSIWWMDNCFYTYLPCQRLAMAYGNLGNAAKSLYWAREALVNIPPKGHDALIEEAQKNIEILEGL